MNIVKCFFKKLIHSFWKPVFEVDNSFALCYYVKGNNNAEIGQRAAHATHALLKKYATGEFDHMTEEDFANYVKDLDIRKKLTKKDILEG